jgi:hypothetical protein
VGAGASRALLRLQLDAAQAEEFLLTWRKHESVPTRGAAQVDIRKIPIRHAGTMLLFRIAYGGDVRHISKQPQPPQGNETRS